MKENLALKLDILQAQLARVTNKPVQDPKLNLKKHVLTHFNKHGNVIMGRNELEVQIEQTKKLIIQRKKYHAFTKIKRVLKQFKKVEPLRIKKRMKTAENKDRALILQAELDLVSSMDIEFWANRIISKFFCKHFGQENDPTVNVQMNVEEINVNSRINKSEAIKNVLSKLLESCKRFLESSDEAATDRQEINDMSRVELQTLSQNDDFPHDFEYERDLDSNSDDSQQNYNSEENQFNPLINQQTALPELQEGFISGSDYDEDEGEMTIGIEHPQRRNRRGQRARRKIWEQKFGNRANHLIKEMQKNQELEEKKLAKKRKRDELHSIIKRQKIEYASKPLHPSWEAKQKLKEKQAKTEFHGKKIQFN